MECYENIFGNTISKDKMKMEEDKLRLKKLIEHWAEHNDEHSTRLKESAKKASEINLPKVAEELKRATEAGKKVSEHLRSALEKMKHPEKYTSSG